ncbi:ATP-dependent DNA helicase PIF1-like [Camellia sinensis]|uniref:ATP-dependent DNA helicase PIF1-like n=1 Tax=Camellia sinensis TaxID=4442 RepID=UPI0010361FF3|nr:ATP-dependent DNA helicase PIF1-like [Camellia sinensis]
MDQDGYPIYRRRNNGQAHIVRGKEVDNRDIIPYNVYLSKRFNCHINVEADVEIIIDRLNNDQRIAYDAIASSVFENKRTIFFLNGGAGTGKTFLYNAIALKCHNVGHIVITVASFGIASLLLVGVCTAHSTFSIPLDVLENSICGFSKQSLQAELFRETKLIIWDEVPMQHRHCVKAVDRTLRDTCDSEKPFGIGTNPQEIVKLPSTIHKCQDLKDIILVVYPQLDVAMTSTATFLTERTILSARNDDVSAINTTTLNIFPDNTHTYLAADKMSEDDEIDHGLCNGTRLMVSRCNTRIIEAQILTGEKCGNLVFIPRISLTPPSSEMPFLMRRHQFPVRLAYALTINKSQGQSVKFVGVDLRTPVFSNGQLYVALSRCTSFDRISVLLPNDKPDSTTNIVYPEILL